MSKYAFSALLSLALATSAFAQAKPPAAPSFPEKPTLTTPNGAYQTAWLNLEGQGEPIRAFLALRDGKPVQFWSTNMRLPGTPAKLQGSLKLLTDAARGQTNGNTVNADIDLRLVSIWAPMTRFAAMTLNLNFTTSNGQLTGTWSNNVDGKAVSGKLSGTILDDAAAQKAHALAKGQDWPSFYGTGAASRGPDYGKPIVDDLANAKPLWRSEVVSLSGWGTGTDSRYASRSAYGTLCGGSSSPIVADGKVYLYHYWPSGDVNPEGKDAEMLAKFDHPVEKELMRKYFSTRADVVITCLDAANGKTVWQSVWPQKQSNYQTHKWRGLNHTPAFAKGILVASDYSMGLQAHDAKTGELKWSLGGGGNISKDQGAIGPVISGDVVIWTRKATVALDLATGKELWKGPESTGARRMIINGQERILLTGPKLILVDPATGKELASADYPGGIDKNGRKDLGRGIYANLICDGPYIVSFEQSDKGATAFALKVSSDGTKIEPAWRHEVTAVLEDGHTAFAIANGKVFFGTQGTGAYMVELATGKTLKHLPEFTTHSNPIHITVDNRLFWQPECQHGDQKIQLFDADTFTPLGKNWDPPHNDTTAYGEMAISNVVVDGRLIIRGIDGIYCYDVRADRK